MTDQLLDILKYALLALLYLFFARVLWAVWSEVRGPRAGHLVAAPADTGDATRPTVAPPPARARRPGRGMIAKLVVIQPRERKGAAFTIVGEARVGRAATCPICIPDDSFVSQVHARLFHAEGLSWVEDLRSTNGTFLNGARIAGTHQITKGDRLQIGSTVWEAH